MVDAWGHDELKPLSKSYHDWYGVSLYMTPVDALDTMIFMKLDEDAAKTKELVVNGLSFKQDIYVKNFEITIRLLGGLLASYRLLPPWAKHSGPLGSAGLSRAVWTNC